jgi:hypothetical protein
MRTITYNDEAALWSRNNYVLGTRLLPSSDGSDNIFMDPFLERLAKMMVN